MSIYFQLSFLVPPEIVPGRLGLLVTLFLCQVNVLNNLVETKPRSHDGPTAILQWAGVCVSFISGAMAVYGWILFSHLNSCPKDGKKDDKAASNRPKETKKYRTGYRLDMTMILLFPPVYFVVAIAFWVAV